MQRGPGVYGECILSIESSRGIFTTRALSLFKVYVDNALPVLNSTLLNSVIKHPFGSQPNLQNKDNQTVFNGLRDIVVELIHLGWVPHII